MEKLNVYNIPNNILYQFDENRYVWNVSLPKTREGNYEGSMEYTEVYEKNNGLFNIVVSGRLINNPNTMKEDEFSIFDYDQDTRYSFKQNMPLREANLDDMYLFRECINRMNKKNKLI